MYFPEEPASVSLHAAKGIGSWSGRPEVTLPFLQDNMSSAWWQADPRPRTSRAQSPGSYALHRKPGTQPHVRYPKSAEKYLLRIWVFLLGSVWLNPIIARDSSCPVSTAVARKVCCSGQFSWQLSYQDRKEKRVFPRGRDLLESGYNGLWLNKNQEKQSGRGEMKGKSTQQMTLDSNIFAAGQGSQPKQSDNHAWCNQQLQ